MTAVSVCIPAYRAAPFIAETLRSVQRQTHADLRVEIAVEPSREEPADDTVAAVTPFLSDRRFRVRKNPLRLGWDSNIRSMLQRVDTPFFMILPHDDVVHPDYVETLLAALDARPEAVVAYGDMDLFGHTAPSRKWVDLPADGTRDERLLAFFLAGAEAVPWRGVTRTRVVASIGGFRVDRSGGFASECEWALELLLQGPAVRVPRTLYSKRIHPPFTETASSLRYLNVPREELYRAWRSHRSRMVGALEHGRGHIEPARDVVRLAAQAAMLQRHFHVLGPVLPPEEVLEASRLLEHAVALSADVPEARRVAAMLHLVLSRHELASGRTDDGARHAESAVACDPANADALIHLSRVRLLRGRARDALEVLARAEAVAAGVAGIEELRGEILALLG